MPVVTRPPLRSVPGTEARPAPGPGESAGNGEGRAAATLAGEERGERGGGWSVGTGPVGDGPQLGTGPAGPYAGPYARPYAAPMTAGPTVPRAPAGAVRRAYRIPSR